MTRRNFLKIAGLTSASGLLPTAPLNVWGAPTNGFNGLFYINIQATGGWDVTSFCDPKRNQPGAKLINNWSTTNSIQVAGNLKYAPVANNAKFFSEQAAKTLVINGINTHTNAHSAGRNFNNTGSSKNGMPNLSALYAFEKAQGLAMPVMIKGSIVTSGLLAPTILGAEAFKLINPNKWQTSSPTLYMSEDDLASINMLQDLQAQNLKLSQYELPKQKKQIDEYYAAVFADTSGFNEFPNIYNNIKEGDFSKNAYTDALKFALSAFKSGLGIAADIAVDGFDTHEQQDTKIIEPLNDLTNSLGALWFFAEQLGVSDRLLVSVASDFGRTPFYNDGLGKDHWPFTSHLIMKSGATWTNRTIGGSDAELVGYKLDPLTLKTDNNRGIDIEPVQVHYGLRQILGLQGSVADKKFDLGTAPKIDLFNPALHT